MDVIETLSADATSHVASDKNPSSTIGRSIGLMSNLTGFVLKERKDGGKSIYC